MANSNVQINMEMTPLNSPESQEPLSTPIWLVTHSDNSNNNSKDCVSILSYGTSANNSFMTFVCYHWTSIIRLFGISTWPTVCKTCEKLIACYKHVQPHLASIWHAGMLLALKGCVVVDVLNLGICAIPELCILILGIPKLSKQF